ncbi:hypothetical protein [Umezawaea tangerina]|nr:hypothetical protein [Umezawaea tangerina]
MTVQVRAGLGERRLTAAVRDVFDRHQELRESGAVCEVRRVPVHGLAGQALVDRAAAEVDAVANRVGSALFRVLWLDAGADLSGKLVLLVHRRVMAAVPWPVLLSELVSAWNRGDSAADLVGALDA